MPHATTRTLKTGGLLLDPRNTRIPPELRTADQRALLHALIEHEDVRGLAASIARLGLFPNERLVVIPSNRRHIVVEGNRRLAAIKLLLNPELAATKREVTYFRRLSGQTNLTALTKVEVSILKDRIAAAPVLAALHTREAKRKWSTLQQARFYRELVEEGQSPPEIAENLGITLGQVRSYLRAETIHTIAVDLDYPEKVRTKLEDSRFPLSTLERFFESKLGRKFLGVKLDDNGSLQGIVHRDRFRAVLRQVATDVATIRGLTRQINDEAGFQKYIDRTEPKIPATKKRGSFQLSELDSSLAEASSSPPTPKVKRTRRPRPSKSVVPSGFSCTSPNQRVRAIYDELKGLEISKQRNTTGVMLRVLIDISLWSYLIDKKLDKDACNHIDKNKKKRKHNPDWTPPLRDLLSFCVEKRVFPGMVASAYKALRMLVAKDAEYIVTIDTFNQFTHNPYGTPTEEDLRALWNRAEPMLEIVLN